MYVGFSCFDDAESKSEVIFRLQREKMIDSFLKVFLETVGSEFVNFLEAFSNETFSQAINASHYNLLFVSVHLSETLDP